jgi:hypothetical protein
MRSWKLRLLCSLIARILAHSRRTFQVRNFSVDAEARNIFP